MKKKSFKNYLCLFSLLTIFFILSGTANAEVILTVVNANTNSDLFELSNGGTINLGNTGSALNIRADISPTPALVRFYLNGSLVQTEGKAPFTIGGDTAGNYNAWSPPVRTNTLKVTAHNEAGNIIDQRTMQFTVSSGTVNAEVILTVVNANTNSDLFELSNGSTINLGNTGNELNIRADISPTPALVRFYLNGSLVQTEGKAPFTIGGDTAGNYNAWSPPVRTNTLKVTAHNKAGNTIKQRTIQFTVNSGNASFQTYNGGRGDIISLHYDFSPDPDDGHSAAADITIYKKHQYNRMMVLGTMSKYGPDWTTDTFHTAARTLFNNIYGPNNWYDASSNWGGAVINVANRWRNVLNSGGHVWIKEGGPSDFSADVIHRLQNALGVPAWKTKDRIHLVQHGPQSGALNEVHTASGNLTFVKNNTDYIKIANGNKINATAGLNSDVYGSNEKTSKIKSFRNMAYASSSAAAWREAFAFWNPLNDGKPDTMTKKLHPWHRLDFSDTVELLRILGINNVTNPETFANIFFN